MVAVAVVLAACGTRSGISDLSSSPPNAGLGGGPTQGGGGTSPDGGSGSGGAPLLDGGVAGSGGTMSGGAAGTAGGGASAGVGGGTPASCDDVGGYPGYATCCQGKYCAGACYLGQSCECGKATGGCLWPEVCCGFQCVGPFSPKCDGAYPLEAGEYVEVDGGSACLPKLGPNYVLVKRSCCNGKLCEGKCLQFKGQSKPECWCGDLPSGVPGGCQGGHVCCQNNCTDLVNCQVGG